MFKNLLIAVCALAATVPAARAADLWQVWQLATQNDPAFKQALANRNASMQARPLAWAKLFPSIDLSAARTWDNSTGSQRSFSPFVGSSGGFLTSTRAGNGPQNQWGATLTQTLFNWQQFQAVQTSGYTVSKARADYEVALQGLIVSVSQAYFNVLNAKDVLNADLANEKALNRQYQQAQTQYQVGLIAVTGVRQAEAAYDQARAQVILDRQALAQAREALRAITGRYISELQAPGASLPLLPPQPSNVQTWVRTGFEDSPALASTRFAQKIADNLVDEQRSGYLPNLNLVLQHSYVSGNGNASSCSSVGAPPCVPATGDPSRSTDNQIALQLSWNVFAGGGTRAAVKQQQYRADSAMDAEIAERRSVEQNVRNAYLAVLSGIAQVKATRQAVAAARIALKATAEGLKVGTQTTLDVLTSRQSLIAAQKGFYNARYTYLVSVLQLEQAAGTVTPADLKRLSDWLTAPGAAAPGASSAPYPATTG